MPTSVQKMLIEWHFFYITEYLPPDDIPEGCTCDVICDGAHKALPNDLPLSEILIPLMDKLADYIETRKRCNLLKPESKLKVVFNWGAC